MTTKIFVGNIKNGAYEEDLRALFEKFGEVAGCDIIKNYAFVHMVNESDAIVAVAELHNTVFEGKTIRCELSNKGRKQDGNTEEEEGQQKIFVGNIKSWASEEDLRAMFQKYGAVTDCVIINNYAFVHMANRYVAAQAVEELHNTIFEGKPIRCELSTKDTRGRVQAREVDNGDDSEGGSQKIFVGNIKTEASESDLRVKFEKYGEVFECDIINNYAFVHMANKSDAIQAVEALHSSVFEGKVIRCELSTKQTQGRNTSRGESSYSEDVDSGGNSSNEGPQKIFVGNVQDADATDKLKAAFEKYGEVKECDIMKGYAFVHMYNETEAKQAVAELHNSIFEGRLIRCEISNKKTQGRQRTRDGKDDACYPQDIRRRGRGRGRDDDYQQRSFHPYASAYGARGSRHSKNRYDDPQEYVEQNASYGVGDPYSIRDSLLKDLHRTSEYGGDAYESGHGSSYGMPVRGFRGRGNSGPRRPTGYPSF